MNDYTVEIAETLITALRSNGVACKEVNSHVVLANMVRRMLRKQVDNLYEIDDILNHLCYEYMVNGYDVAPSKRVAAFLKDRGRVINEQSPRFEDLPGRTQDDTLEGAEIVPNDMSQVEGFEMTPGMDLHAAMIDIEDRFGLGDMFEYMIAGETEESIAEALGMSRLQVQRRKLQIRAFLYSNGYFGG